MNENDLTYIDEHGLIGTNFYWHKHESQGVTKEEILSVGLTNDRVRVHKDIIKPLQQVDREFQKKGYRLYIKEGYRSKDLYDLIYKRRVEKFGKEQTERLLNMNDMPHATGTSIDLALWDATSKKEVYLRNAEDGMDALFVDFYKEKTDEQSMQYQDLQTWIISILEDHGFRLGTKREYFHFDYRP